MRTSCPNPFLGASCFCLSLNVISSKLFQIYISILAIASIIASPKWRDLTSLHLALLLFINLIIYIALDGWPYANILPEPFDPPTEPATWVRLGLLTFGGLVVPLAMPRPFRPLTPDAEPDLYDTSCLFSRYTFSYLDSIVLYGYRAPEVTVKDMPQIPAAEKIEALGKRVLARFDPAQVGKRDFIWGVLRMWKKEFVIMIVLNVLQTFVKFASPFALRNLLGYVHILI